MENDGNYIEVKIFNYLLEIDFFFYKFLKRIFQCLDVLLLRVGHQNDAQMPCWLGPWTQI